ncbi:hypothetical protein GGX14DRAFT_654170 [Mycena pura]|uniref:Uncharacterized protein n=1 Tax=Mycena pura TaxID=153505 RepID=A0AAD6YCF2_9AGAR|nr:hypothetical protein GGX14DRAFT_654170 [Mycena pura]
MAVMARPARPSRRRHAQAPPQRLGVGNAAKFAAINAVITATGRRHSAADFEFGPSAKQTLSLSSPFAHLGTAARTVATVLATSPIHASPVLSTLIILLVGGGGIITPAAAAADHHRQRYMDPPEPTSPREPLRPEAQHLRRTHHPEAEAGTKEADEPAAGAGSSPPVTSPAHRPFASRFLSSDLDLAFAKSTPGPSAQPEDGASSGAARPVPDDALDVILDGTGPAAHAMALGQHVTYRFPCHEVVRLPSACGLGGLPRTGSRATRVVVCSCSSTARAVRARCGCRHRQHQSWRRGVARVARDARARRADRCAGRCHAGRAGAPVHAARAPGPVHVADAPGPVPRARYGHVHAARPRDGGELAVRAEPAAVRERAAGRGDTGSGAAAGYGIGGGSGYGTVLHPLAHCTRGPTAHTALSHHAYTSKEHVESEATTMRSGEEHV